VSHVKIQSTIVSYISRHNSALFSRFVRLAINIFIQSRIVSFDTWVKLDASSGTVQEILQQDGTNGKIWLYRRPEATLGTYLGGTPLLSTNTIPIESWVFVAVSYDTSTVRLYLNGSLEASAAKTLQSETSGMLVGVSKTSDSYWNGGIDNLRIYNRQLSDNDILDAYRLGR
jgi:hypothetical protein